MVGEEVWWGWRVFVRSTMVEEGEGWEEVGENTGSLLNGSL